MQTRFTPYSASVLPNGFRYPEKYIQLSKQPDLFGDIEWWFEDANTEGSQLAWQLRTRYSEWLNIDDKKLVPFARQYDDAAFFDGSNITGNPKVIVIDLGNKQRSYELPDFESWLDDAIEGSGIKR